MMVGRLGVYTRNHEEPVMAQLSSMSFVITAAWLMTLSGGHRTTAAAPSAVQPASAATRSELITVTSSDGARIGVECAGSGPTLLVVHGGVGDRTRWTPMFPLLSSTFTTCAMDRRGRGASGDTPEYSLAKEAEDVAAVVNSRSGPVSSSATRTGAWRLSKPRSGPTASPS
jgi:hypothetical protein